MSRLRRQTWKSVWARPLARSGMLWAGGACLLACAVLLIAAVVEPGTDPGSGLWITVGVIAGCIGVGLVLTIMVTNPGWRTAVAGAVIAVAAAIGGWLVYSVIPEPGYEAFIPQRQAMAALAFGFGVIGGGLILLGEMLTDGKLPPPRWRPPVSLTVRVCILSVAVVVVAASLGAPAANRWADDANTDTSIARGDAPRNSELKLARAGKIGEAGGGWGTPHGILVHDKGGEEASMAYTMKDPDSGDERWHHRRWDRIATEDPVLSPNKKLVALSSQGRDEAATQYLTILRADTGALRADIPIRDNPGELRVLTEKYAVYADVREPRTLIARDFDGQQAWEYSAPPDCLLSAAESDGDRIAAALACRSETEADERAQVVVLDAKSGDKKWDWKSKTDGSVSRNGLVITPDLVVADVRRDESGNDSLFAAREYKHDLSALSLDKGKRKWHRDNLDLGDTYSPACAGTLKLAGTSQKDGRLLLGECHQVNGEEGGRFDVTAYKLDDGKRAYQVKSDLGYAPQREDDTTGWFEGLPDGRAVVAADGSMDLKHPDCSMYVSGPKKSDKRDSLPVPDSISDGSWCRQVSLQLTPSGMTASFPKSKTAGQYFAID